MRFNSSGVAHSLLWEYPHYYTYYNLINELLLFQTKMPELKILGFPQKLYYIVCGNYGVY